MPKFYREYRTPRLSVRRDGSKSVVLLADGRELLHEEYHQDTPIEELTEAAEKECLFLALRNMIDIVPLLRPYTEEGEHIQLSKEKAYEVRYVAFLRGRVLYVNQGKLKARCGALWGMMLRRIIHHEEESFPGNGAYRGISCDSACEMTPEDMHDDIYLLGRAGGGKGFNRGDIWAIAEENNIIIDEVPRHPLEAVVNVNVEQKLQKMDPNPLPPPPVILNTKQAESKYKINETIIWKQARTSYGYETVYKRLAGDARDPIYRIGDEWVNRYQFMDYLVWTVSENKFLLKDICQGKDGMPSMMEVIRWRDLHPDFDHALRVADRAQAAIFADKATEEIEKVTDKDEVPVAKLKSQYFMKRAALGDERFRDKQVIQTQDLDKRDEHEMKRQLFNILMSKPGLIPNLEPVVIEGEVIEESTSKEGAE
jgi:hypothetical protein